MSRCCPACGHTISPNSRTAYYNGGLYHADCAESIQRNEQRSARYAQIAQQEAAERQEQMAREATERQEQMAREAAERQEQIARESAAIQEQLARETLWEQQQARMKAEEVEQHAREQKELTQEDILYRNSLDAAKDGDIDSMVYVAKCMLEGKVVSYSESRIKAWLLKAIEGNSYEALTMIYRVWTSLTSEEKESTISKWDLIVGYSVHATKEDYINIFKCLRNDKNSKEAFAFFDRHKEKMPVVKAWIAGHTHKCIQCGKQFFDENNINAIFCSESCEIKYKTGRK